MVGIPSGHDQVVPGADAAGRRAVGALLGRGPVGHNEAVKAEFLPRDAGAEVIAVGRVDPVDQVVAGHHGERVRPADRDPESAQVDLAQRPLGNDAVAEHAVVLLVVAAEVLDGGAAAGMALDTPGDCCGRDAADQGILRVIFKISSAEGVAVDVHAGRQPEGDAEALHFIADQVADLFDERRIPGLGQKGPHRDRRAELVPFFALELHTVRKETVLQAGFRRHGNGVSVPDIVLAAEAQARRPVRQGDLRDPLVQRASAGFARGAGYRDAGCPQGAVYVLHGPAYGKMDELVCAERPDELVRLCLQCHAGLIRSGCSCSGFTCCRRSFSIFYFHRLHSGQVPGLQGQAIGKSGHSGFSGHEGCPVQLLQLFPERAHRCGQGEHFFFCKGEGRAERTGPQGSADPEAVGARLQDPCVAVLRVGGQVLRSEGEGQFLAFEGGQDSGLGKSGQAALFFFKGAVGEGDIELDDLPAAVFGAGVGDAGPDRDCSVRLRLQVLISTGFRLKAGHLDGKAGVGEAVAKEVPSRNTEAVKIAVADVDALPVICLVPDGGHFPERGRGRVVVVVPGPGVGQLSAGRDGARQDIRYRIAALHAGLGDVEDRLDLVIFVQKA